MDFRQIEWVLGGSIHVALLPATDARHQDLRDDCHRQSENEYDAAGDGHIPSDLRAPIRSKSSKRIRTSVGHPSHARFGGGPTGARGMTGAASRI